MLMELFRLILGPNMFTWVGDIPWAIEGRPGNILGYYTEEQ